MTLKSLSWAFVLLTVGTSAFAQDNKDRAREIVIKALKETPCPTKANPEASCADGLKGKNPFNQTFGKIGLKNSEQQNRFALNVIREMGQDDGSTENVLTNIVPYLKTETRIKLMVNYLETTLFSN